MVRKHKTHPQRRPSSKEGHFGDNIRLQLGMKLPAEDKECRPEAFRWEWSWKMKFKKTKRNKRKIVCI